MRVTFETESHSTFIFYTDRGIEKVRCIYQDCTEETHFLDDFCYVLRKEKRKRLLGRQKVAERGKMPIF